jgi:hypothetical protein
MQNISVHQPLFPCLRVGSSMEVAEAIEECRQLVIIAVGGD